MNSLIESPQASHLGLARAGNGTVGAAGRDSSTVGLGSTVGTSRGGDLEVAHVDERLLASVAARAANLGSLVVCSNVEGDEEQQVRGDDTNTGESGELLTGTLAHVGSPGEVGGGEVGVGGEVDEA